MPSTMGSGAMWQALMDRVDGVKSQVFDLKERGVEIVERAQGKLTKKTKELRPKLGIRVGAHRTGVAEEKSLGKHVLPRRMPLCWVRCLFLPQKKRKGFSSAGGKRALVTSTGGTDRNSAWCSTNKRRGSTACRP